MSKRPSPNRVQVSYGIEPGLLRLFEAICKAQRLGIATTVAQLMEDYLLDLANRDPKLFDETMEQAITDRPEDKAAIAITYRRIHHNTERSKELMSIYADPIYKALYKDDTL